MSKQNHFPAGIVILDFMVAMMLSAFLAGVLAMIYLVTHKNQTTQIALQAIQENARLATELLRRNIHQAGNIGCAHLSSDFPLQNAGEYVLTPQTRITGSNDSLTIRGGDLASDNLRQAMSGLSVLYISSALHFTPDDVAMISDCQTAEIFQIKTIEKISPDLQKIISQNPLHKQYGTNAELRAFAINTYVIGDTKQRDPAGTIIQALYLKNLKNHKIELVAGVDAMRLDFDVIENGRLRTVQAGQVQDWAQVVGVKFTLELTAYPLHKTWYGYAAIPAAKIR